MDMMRLHFWERFSSYDNSIDESTFAKLIEDNFASLSMKGESTNHELVERIAQVSNVPIPVESLPERPCGGCTCTRKRSFRLPRRLF